MNKKIKLPLALLLVSAATASPPGKVHITNLQSAEFPKNPESCPILFGLPRQPPPNFPEGRGVESDADTVMLHCQGVTTYLKKMGNHCFAVNGQFFGIAPQEELARLLQGMVPDATREEFLQVVRSIEDAKGRKGKKDEIFNACKELVAEAISICGEQAGFARIPYKDITRNTELHMSLKLGYELELAFVVCEPDDKTGPCKIHVSLFSDSPEVFFFKGNEQTALFVGKLECFANELEKYKHLNPNLEKVIKDLALFPKAIEEDLINQNISRRDKRETEECVQIQCYGTKFLVPLSHPLNRDSVEDLIKSESNKDNGFRFASPLDGAAFKAQLENFKEEIAKEKGRDQQKLEGVVRVADSVIESLKVLAVAEALKRDTCVHLFGAAYIERLANISGNSIYRIVMLNGNSNLRFLAIGQLPYLPKSRAIFWGIDTNNQGLELGELKPIGGHTVPVYREKLDMNAYVKRQMSLALKECHTMFPMIGEVSFFGKALCLLSAVEERKEVTVLVQTPIYAPPEELFSSASNLLTVVKSALASRPRTPHQNLLIYFLNRMDDALRSAHKIPQFGYFFKPFNDSTKTRVEAYHALKSAGEGRFRQLIAAFIEIFGTTETDLGPSSPEKSIKNILAILASRFFGQNTADEAEYMKKWFDGLNLEEFFAALDRIKDESISIHDLPYITIPRSLSELHFDFDRVENNRLDDIREPLRQLLPQDSKPNPNINLLAVSEEDLYIMMDGVLLKMEGVLLKTPKAPQTSPPAFVLFDRTGPISIGILLEHLKTQHPNLRADDKGRCSATLLGLNEEILKEMRKRAELAARFLEPPLFMDLPNIIPKEFEQHESYTLSLGLVPQGALCLQIEGSEKHIYIYRASEDEIVIGVYGDGKYASTAVSSKDEKDEKSKLDSLKEKAFKALADLNFNAPDKLIEQALEALFHENIATEAGNCPSLAGYIMGCLEQGNNAFVAFLLGVFASVNPNGSQDAEPAEDTLKRGLPFLKNPVLELSIAPRGDNPGLAALVDLSQHACFPPFKRHQAAPFYTAIINPRRFAEMSLEAMRSMVAVPKEMFQMNIETLLPPSESSDSAQIGSYALPEYIVNKARSLKGYFNIQSFDDLRNFLSMVTPESFRFAQLFASLGAPMEDIPAILQALPFGTTAFNRSEQIQIEQVLALALYNGCLPIPNDDMLELMKEMSSDSAENSIEVVRKVLFFNLVAQFVTNPDEQKLFNELIALEAEISLSAEEKKELLSSIGELNETQFDKLVGQFIPDPLAEPSSNITAIVDKINALESKYADLVKSLVLNKSQIFKRLHELRSSRPQANPIKTVEYLTREELIRYFGGCLKDFASTKLSRSGAQAIVSGAADMLSGATSATRKQFQRLSASLARFFGASDTSSAPAPLPAAPTAAPRSLTEDDRYYTFALLAYLVTLESPLFAPEFAKEAANFLGLLDPNGAPNQEQFLEEVKYVLEVTGVNADVKMLEKLLMKLNEERDTPQACELRCLAQVILEHSNFSRGEMAYWQRLKGARVPMSRADTVLLPYWKELNKKNQSASMVVLAYKGKMQPAVMERVLAAQGEAKPIDLILQNRIAASSDLMKQAAKFAKDASLDLAALKRLTGSRYDAGQQNYICATLLAGMGITDPVQLALRARGFFAELTTDPSKVTLSKVVIAAKEENGNRDDHMKQQLRDIAAGIGKDKERRFESVIVLWNTLRNIIVEMFKSNLVPELVKYLDHKVSKPADQILNKNPYIGIIILSWVVQDPFPISLPDIALKMQCLVDQKSIQYLQENDLESLQELMNKALAMLRGSPKEFLKRIVRAFEVASKVPIQECSLSDYMTHRGNPDFLGSRYQALDEALASANQSFDTFDSMELIIKGFCPQGFDENIRVIQEANAKLIIGRLENDDLRTKCAQILLTEQGRYTPSEADIEAKAQYVVQCLRKLIPELDDKSIATLLNDDPQNQATYLETTKELLWKNEKKWQNKLIKAITAGSQVHKLMDDLGTYYGDNLQAVIKQIMNAEDIEGSGPTDRKLSRDATKKKITECFDQNGRTIGGEASQVLVSSIRAFLKSLADADIESFRAFTNSKNLDIYCTEYCKIVADALKKIRGSWFFLSTKISCSFGDLEQALYFFYDTDTDPLQRHIKLSARRICFLLHYFKDANRSEDSMDLQRIQNQLNDKLINQNITETTPDQLLKSIPDNLTTKLSEIAAKRDMRITTEIGQADGLLQEIRNLLELMNTRDRNVFSTIGNSAEIVDLPPFEYLNRLQEALKKGASRGRDFEKERDYLDQSPATSNPESYYSLREALSFLDPFFGNIPKHPCVMDPVNSTADVHAASAKVLTKGPELAHAAMRLVKNFAGWAKGIKFGQLFSADPVTQGRIDSFISWADHLTDWDLPRIAHYMLNFCTTLFCLDGDPDVNQSTTEQRKAILRILFLLKVLSVRLWDSLATVILNPDLLLDCFLKSANPKYLRHQYVEMENNLRTFGYGACSTHHCSLITEEVIGLLALSIRNAAKVILPPVSCKAFEYFLHYWLVRISREDMISKCLGLTEWYNTSDTETMYNNILILLDRIEVKNKREIGRLCGLLRSGLADEEILARVQLQMDELLKEALAKFDDKKEVYFTAERLKTLLDSNAIQREHEVSFVKDVLNLNSYIPTFISNVRGLRVTPWIPSPDPAPYKFSISGAVKALFPSKKRAAPALGDLRMLIEANEEELTLPGIKDKIFEIMKKIEEKESLGEPSTWDLFRIINLLQEENIMFRQCAAKLLACVDCNGLDDGGINRMNDIMQDFLIWLVGSIFTPHSIHAQPLTMVPSTRTDTYRVEQSFSKPRRSTDINPALAEYFKAFFARVLIVFDAHKEWLEEIEALVSQHFPMFKQDLGMIKYGIYKRLTESQEFSLFFEKLQQRLPELPGMPAQERLAKSIGQELDIVTTLSGVAWPLFGVPVLGPILSALSMGGGLTTTARVKDSRNCFIREIAGLLAQLFGYDPNTPLESPPGEPMEIYVPSKKRMLEKQKTPLAQIPDFPLSPLASFHLSLELCVEVASVRRSQKPIEEFLTIFLARPAGDPTEMIRFLKENTTITNCLVQILKHSNPSSAREHEQFKRELESVLSNTRLMRELLDLINFKLGFFALREVFTTPGLNQHAPRVLFAVYRFFDEDATFRLLQVLISYHQSPKAKRLESALCASSERVADNNSLKLEVSSESEFSLRLESLELNRALPLWFLIRMIFEAYSGTEYSDSTAALIAKASKLDTSSQNSNSQKWNCFLQHRINKRYPINPPKHDPTYGLMVFDLSPEEARQVLDKGFDILDSIASHLQKNPSFDEVIGELVGIFIRDNGKEVAEASFEQFAIQAKRALEPVIAGSAMQKLGSLVELTAKADFPIVREMFPFGWLKLAAILPIKHFAEMMLGVLQRQPPTSKNVQAIIELANTTKLPSEPQLTNARSAIPFLRTKIQTSAHADDLSREILAVISPKGTDYVFFVQKAAELSVLPGSGVVSDYVTRIIELADRCGFDNRRSDPADILKTFDEALNFLSTQALAESADWPSSVSDTMITNRWPLEDLAGWDTSPRKRQILRNAVVVGQMIKSMNFTSVCPDSGNMVDRVFMNKMKELSDCSLGPVDYIALFNIYSGAVLDLKRIVSLQDFGLHLGSLPAKLVYKSGANLHHDNPMHNAEIKQIVLDILRGNAVLFATGLEFVTRELRYALQIVSQSSPKIVADFAKQILDLDQDSTKLFGYLLSLICAIEASDMHFIKGSRFDRGLHAPDIDKGFGLIGSVGHLRNWLDKFDKFNKDKFPEKYAYYQRRNPNGNLGGFLTANPEYATAVRKFFADNGGTLGSNGGLVHAAQSFPRFVQLLSGVLNLFKDQCNAVVGQGVLQFKASTSKGAGGSTSIISSSKTQHPFIYALHQNLQSLETPDIRVFIDRGSFILGSPYEALFRIAYDGVAIFNPGTGRTAMSRHLTFLSCMIRALENKPHGLRLAGLVELLHHCREVRSKKCVEYTPKNSLPTVLRFAEEVYSKAQMSIGDKGQNQVDLGLGAFKKLISDYGAGAILPDAGTLRNLRMDLNYLMRDLSFNAEGKSAVELYNALEANGLARKSDDLRAFDNLTSVLCAYRWISFSAATTLSSITKYVPCADSTSPLRLPFWNLDQIRQKLGSTESSAQYFEKLKHLEDVGLYELMKKYSAFKEKLENRYPPKNRPPEIKQLISDCQDLVEKLKVIIKELGQLVGGDTRFTLGRIKKKIEGLELPKAYLSSTFIAPEMVNGRLVMSEFGEPVIRYSTLNRQARPFNRQARPFIFSGELWILVSGDERSLSAWYLLHIPRNFDTSHVTALNRVLDMSADAWESLRKYMANLVSMVIELDKDVIKAEVPRAAGCDSLQHCDALHAESIARYIQKTQQPINPLAAKIAAYRLLYDIPCRLPIIGSPDAESEGVKTICALDGSKFRLDPRKIPIMPGSKLDLQLANTRRANDGMPTTNNWRDGLKRDLKTIELLFGDCTMETEFIISGQNIRSEFCIRAEFKSNKELAASIKIDFQIDKVGVHILDVPQSSIGSEPTFAIILQFLEKVRVKLQQAHSTAIFADASDMSAKDQSSMEYWNSALAQNQQILESVPESALGIDLLRGADRSNVIVVLDPEHFQPYFWSILSECYHGIVQLDRERIIDALERLIPGHISTKRLGSKGYAGETCLLLTIRTSAGLQPDGGPRIRCVTCRDSRDFKDIKPPEGSHLSKSQMMFLTKPIDQFAEFSLTPTEQSWSKAIAKLFFTMLIAGFCLCLIFVFMNMLITSNAATGEAAEFASVLCTASPDVLQEFGQLEAAPFTIYIPKGKF